MTIAEISREIDTIVINKNELKAILIWSRSHKIDAKEDLNKSFFPFQSFVLKLEMPQTGYQSYLIELDNFNYLKGGKITNDQYTFTYKRSEQNTGWEMDGHAFGSPYSEKSLQELFEVTHVSILRVMFYLATKSRERITKVSPQVTRKERENYEYKPRECFLLNDIVKYMSIHPNKSSIKYRCECWGVRGHIRHLADGRAIFIKPYKKGKMRDVLEPHSKVYLINQDSLKEAKE